MNSEKTHQAKEILVPIAQLVKESTCSARDPDSIPRLGGPPGEGNAYPLHYSCPGNPMDIGACRTAVHGVAKSLTQLSD